MKHSCYANRFLLRFHDSVGAARQHMGWFAGRTRIERRLLVAGSMAIVLVSGTVAAAAVTSTTINGLVYTSAATPTAKPLSRAQVSGVISIFVGAGASQIASVAYFIDSPTGAGPATALSTQSPFVFSPDQSGSFNTAGISLGKHTLLGEVTAVSGKVTDLFARFVVLPAAPPTTTTTSVPVSSTTTTAVPPTTTTVPVYSPPTTSPPTTTGPGTGTNSGFVTRSGQSLVLNGKVTQFIGFDTYGMTGCYNGTAWTTAQLDQYFSGLPANGMTRIWAFQFYGTSKISAILTEAAKYNQHVILTLGDDDSSCLDYQDAPNGDGTGKTLAFYQTDWKTSYLSWVNTIVPMFKSNSTIAMWEIANEPFHSGAHPTLSVQQAYLGGAAQAIKAADPNHLVETGANYAGDFGGQANYTAAQNSPYIDVISFHDYAWDYEYKAVVSNNLAGAQQAAKADNKAFIAGEAGLESGPSCSAATGLSQQAREQYLQAKTTSYLTRGIGVVAYWEYEPADHHNGACSYDIFPGDPMIAFAAAQ